MDYSMTVSMPRAQARQTKPAAAQSANPVRFSGLMSEDYNVEHRIDQPVNPHTTSATLRALLVRDMIKKAKGDPSSLKLFLDGSSTDWFIGTSRAALADSLALINRPVDIIVKEVISDEGLMALQSATGKRLMYDGAKVYMGPIQGSAPYMRNDDHAIRREFQFEYTRDFEHVLMERCGLTNRADLYYKNLNSAKGFNALQALYFGKKGLVDGVLVGFDKVVSRQALEQHIAKNKLTGQALESFLDDHFNLKKIQPEDLKTFSPGSIPSKSPTSPIPDIPVYRDPASTLAAAKKKTEDAKKAADDAAKAAQQSQPAGAKVVATTTQPAPKNLTFYTPKADSFDEIKPESITLRARIKAAEIKAGHIIADNIPGNRGVLEDDVIFFNDGFVDETAEQITDALTSLDKKKRDQKNPSDIKILVNSPGGSIASGLDIRSTINHLKTKVDVIVTGMAASCGAFLVSSATGLRMATPSARIMIHDAWWQRPKEAEVQYNESIDGLDHSTRAFVKAIADASQRPFKEVWEDMKIDVWLNPLESMFYGKRGLTDAILVGDNKAITKQDVYKYLNDTLGGKQKTEKYLENRVDSLRTGNRNWKPENHDESNPFDNPLKTIAAVAKRSGKPLSEIKALKAAVPGAGTSLDHFAIVLPKAAGSGASAISESSQAFLADLQTKWVPSRNKV